MSQDCSGYRTTTPSKFLYSEIATRTGFTLVHINNILSSLHPQSGLTLSLSKKQDFPVSNMLDTRYAQVSLQGLLVS